MQLPASEVADRKWSLAAGLYSRHSVVLCPKEQKEILPLF
jgi:hypothetical protein